MPVLDWSQCAVVESAPERAWAARLGIPNLAAKPPQPDAAYG